MSIFHDIDHGQIKVKRPGAAEERLSRAQSLVVIGGLSALSWAVLISLFVALRGLI